MIEVTMPRLSDSMEEGTILRWLRADGDEISVGYELVEIETDKANMIYEADGSGILSIVAREGDTLPVGAPIAQLLSSSEEKPSGAPAPHAAAPSSPAADGHERSSESLSEATAASVTVPAPNLLAPSTGTPPRPGAAPAASLRDGELKATPLARRIARAHGVALDGLTGSGPAGRIMRADVERAAGVEPERFLEALTGERRATPPKPTSPARGGGEKPETAKGAVEVVELTKLQQTVARRMAESKATAPHFYLQAEIDMSRCVEARGRLKTTREGPSPSLNDMVVKACAVALREFPRANSAYRDGRLELYSRVNVGVAVAAQDALVVPTVFDADKKALREIATETRVLATRVRDGSVTPPELSGGTFTVSNLGMYGMSNIGPVINPPQAGILGVGAIAERAVVHDGKITTAHLMPVTLAGDHRILYGGEGAEFLARIRALLEEPVGLAL